MLFVDYSSTFNTIVPSKLDVNLWALGLNSSVCSWILDFLSGRCQVVKMGNNISSLLTLNTGALQGCVLSPLLYSLYTHDCVATHSSNVIAKFADNTAVVGLIKEDDEMAYRQEVRPITINRASVEKVSSFKFLVAHLKWSVHMETIIKKAHQQLFLRRLGKFEMSSSILRSFYTCTVESILSGCITVWYGNSTVLS